MLTSGLVSWKEHFDFLWVPYETGKAVILANSKTKEFDTVRGLLLPGLLKTVFSNKAEKLPHKIFEVADVCLLDPSTDTGARNERHVCVLYSDNNKTGFEIIHGVLDMIMKKFGIKEQEYQIKVSSHPTYFENKQVEVFLREKSIGHMGVLHPEVLKSYKIVNPISILEINVEPIFNQFEASC